MARKVESLQRAKNNRHEPTAAEAILWRALRGRRFQQTKFRREHVIGPYVVDFACVAARLVIEVDGPSHDRQEQKIFDADRTAFLERAGWRVVRVSNADVFCGFGRRIGRYSGSVEGLVILLSHGREKVARRAG
ncbi:MAG: DUF559 domain-containing protein [Alphaproteobacteria bacterium]|nr:DUF559 domain-containing protein [Alphaproteobacteria bacterium]